VSRRRWPLRQRRR